MALGTLTIVDDQASVGPVKFTRITLVGDGAYPSGGSVGFQTKFCAALKEKRTVMAVYDNGPNGDAKFEYTPMGAPKICSVSTAGLFTTKSAVDPRTGTGGDAITHGLSSGDAVQLVASNMGDARQNDSRLPGGFAENTTYYVIASGLTTTAFKLSATSGGSAITPTDVGSGLYEVVKSDKLLNRVISSAAESQDADQSDTTYNLFVISY